MPARNEASSGPEPRPNGVDATFNHDTRNGKWRRAHIERMRRLHSPGERKVTAIVEEYAAIDYALEWETWRWPKRSVRHHPQGTLAAAENIRGGPSRLSIDG